MIGEYHRSFLSIARLPLLALALLAVTLAALPGIQPAQATSNALPLTVSFVQPADIPEDGGETVINARLNRTSSHDTTIRVRLGSSRRATADSTTITIPAGHLFTSSPVTVTAVDNDVIGDYRLRISGSATNPAHELDDPEDVYLTVIDDDAPIPDAPANFRVTSEKGKTTFSWDNVATPRLAHRLSYRVFVRELGGTEADWTLVIHNDYVDEASWDDNSPLTIQRLPLGTYEFAMQVVAIVRLRGTGSPFYGEYTRAVRHTVRGPNRPLNLDGQWTADGAGIRLTWQPPQSFPDDWILPPVMPVPNPNVDSRVSSYLILRADSYGGPYARIATVGNVLTYTDTSLSDSDRYYYYQVQARSPDGTSDPSRREMVASWSGESGGSLAPETAPATPVNLAATEQSDRIVLTWDAVTGATSYNVLRRPQDDSQYAEIGTSTTNSYTDTTAEVAQGYAYQVEAVNGAGASDASDHVLAIILPPPPPAPTGLSATSVTANAVTLTWTAPDEYTQQYMVLRAVRDADPPEQPSLVAHLGAETTEVTDSSVVAGAAYTYSVIAISAGGQGEAATVDVDIPAATPDSNSGLDAPAGLSATRSGLSVDLTWDAVEGATSYNVLRQDPGEKGHTQLATTTTTSYTGTPPSSGTYSYQVQAVDAEGAGPASGAVTVDIPAPPDPPTNLQATATSSSVTLTWTAPAQTIASYLVSRKVRDADPPQEFAFYAVLGDVTTYTDTGVDADTAYAYQLVAVGLEQSSDPSEVDVDTPPNPLTGLTLVDASDQAVLATLTDGSSVSLADPDGGSYGIRVDLAHGETVGSVSFALSGAKTVTRTENYAPYSLYGDGGQDALHGGTLPAGSYTLTATAYAEKRLGGDVLGTLEVSFTVTQAAAGPLAGLTLVDASDQAVLASLTDGSSVELADPDGGSYGIRADLAHGETVGSVSFALSGAKTVTQTENYAPYSLYGDGGPDALRGQSLPAGSYTLTATAYAEKRLGGDVLGTLEVSFTITGSN